MKESDIRPAALLSGYMDLARRDAERLLADRALFGAVPCPGCRGERADPAFVKQGYAYVRCTDCDTLFLSPRPTPGQMGKFYQDSESVRYWSTHFFRQTEEQRREKMFRPRAALIATWADRLGLSRDGTFVDVGSGYGIFLDEMRKVGRFRRIVGVEPESGLAAVSRNRGFEVLEQVAEDSVEGIVGASFASAFEVLEHVHDADAFLRGVKRLLAPGGVLLLTTLVSTGFDVQVLGVRAKCVYPPQHVNFLSVDGMRRLFERTGYEILEIATPGRLDVDIVRNTLSEPDPPEVGAFVRRLALDAPEATREAFQRFLAENLMSSHVRVLARNPGGAR